MKPLDEFDVDVISNDGTNSTSYAIRLPIELVRERPNAIPTLLGNKQPFVYKGRVPAGTLPAAGPTVDLYVQPQSGLRLRVYA